jgi:hypothetical protein
VLALVRTSLLPKVKTRKKQEKAPKPFDFDAFLGARGGT